MSSGQILGLLLAAGRGRRFDPSGERDKLLVQLDGLAVATRSARTLASACDQCIAICRPGSRKLADAIRDGGIFELYECADADKGMGHSLAMGARIASERQAAALLVMLADLPWLRVDTVQQLLDSWRRWQPVDGNTLILAPRINGRHGHPVMFGAAHFAALQQCTGDRGAAQLLSTLTVRQLDVDDAGILRDVDTPDDLKTDHAN